MVFDALNLSPGRAVRSLMLVLGVASVPSVGLTMPERSHCAQHESMSRHEGNGSDRTSPAHDLDSPAWTQHHDHDCPHCPATECARVSPCSGSTTTALIATSVAVADLNGHRVAVDLARVQAFSSTSQPDTPPPQPIA
jgi:hypothetical protein